MAQWIRVNKEHPCTVCGRTDWDSYCPELRLACCMRLQNNRPARNGGWLYHYEPGNKPPGPIVPRRHTPFSPSRYYEWKQRNNAPVDAQKYLNGLGCDPVAFYRLGVAWASEYGAWAFPMRDSQKNIIGVQLRRLDGQKRAVTGSHNGLFLSSDPANALALICEGVTDTAAALSLGFYALGRQSCQAQSEMVNDFLKREGIQEVVLISDNDDPGVDGGKRLSQSLAVKYCVVIPPAKDLRAFVQSGGTRELLLDMIGQCVWRKNED